MCPAALEAGKQERPSMSTMKQFSLRLLVLAVTTFARHGWK
jgi:hypothetical protein